MSARLDLTPQMADYERKFTDAGEVRWLPYMMYFHPANYRSTVVNTDCSGFRYSDRGGIRYSVSDRAGMHSGRLLAGSSTVFGIGASADRWTLSSRLSENDLRATPWLNFGGRSFNSAQEVILLALYRHLLPKIEEIVLFSGFNNLGLARQPARNRLEHGAFFNCGQFFNAFSSGPVAGKRKGWPLFGRARDAGPPPPMADQIDFAADLTLRHLDVWRAIAVDLGAKLTFILQPLAGWVRAKGCPQEEALFAELDRVGRFSDAYGDILHRDVCAAYAAKLEEGTKRLNVNFVNITPIISETLQPDQWLFVDRIHFTDWGHEFVSKLILDAI